MTEQEYRAAPGISQSELKHILVSPAHYRWAKQNPLSTTEAILMGTLLHELVLEGRVNDRYFRPEGMLFNGKEGSEGKLWLAARGFKTVTAYEESLGFPLLTNAHKTQLIGMRDSLMAHPIVGPILRSEDTETEVVKFYCCGAHEGVVTDNVMLKGRADIIFTDFIGQKCGADIKKVSLGKAKIHAFTKMACDPDRELAFQAAYYVDLFDLKGFMFIAVEDEPFELDDDGNNRHRVEVFEVPQETIAFGRKQYQRALATLAECERTNSWLGRTQEIQYLKYPEWKLAQ